MLLPQQQQNLYQPQYPRRENTEITEFRRTLMSYI